MLYLVYSIRESNRQGEFKLVISYLVLPYKKKNPDYDQEREKESLVTAREAAVEIAIFGQYDNVCIYEEKYDELGELVKCECVDKVWRKG